MNQLASMPTIDQFLNLHPTPATQPPSESERLIRALEAQATAEAQDTADCEALLQATEDNSAKLLLRLIADDQHRHRALLESMVRRLHEEVEFVPSPNAVPVGPMEPTPDAQLASSLRALIRNAHEAARHLRHIGRQESGVYSGLYATLLEVIARDSEKHATVMRFVLNRAEGRHG